MIRNAIHRLKHSMSGATSTVDLFEKNEQNANIMVGFLCLLFSIGLFASLFLLYMGLFEVPDEIATHSMFVPAVFLLLTHILCKQLNGKGSWLKYFMLSILTISAAFCDLFLNYNATIVMIIPVLASIRYFEKKLTNIVSFITAVLFGLSAYLNTIIDSTFFDLNYVGWKDDINILVHGNKFVEAVFEAGFNRSAYTYYYMTENYLPKLILFIILSSFCVLIAGKGREMVLEEEKISTEHARVEQELTTATSIQANMLPTDFPRNDNYHIYASMTPAKEVGGDFYDFFMVDDTHLAIVMADVSGKGVPAALFMVIAKTLIKEATLSESNLGDVFTKVNNKLCENNDDGMFVTAFEGVLDLTTGDFVYVNAGHELPFIYRDNEKFTPYQTKPVFVLAGMEGIKFKEGGVIKLNPGDSIFQYTDGVTEATNLDKELYGMERLELALNKNINTDGEHFLHEIKKDIDNFVGEAPQFDDITMLVLHFKDYM